MVLSKLLGSMKLSRYIAPEHVPVQYGGLSKDNDPDFTSSDAVTEVIIKPSSKHVIELPSTEVGNPLIFPLQQSKDCIILLIL